MYKKINRKDYTKNTKLCYKTKSIFQISIPYQGKNLLLMMILPKIFQNLTEFDLKLEISEDMQYKQCKNRFNLELRRSFKIAKK